MANISDHFTLEEMTSSSRAKQLGLANIPEDDDLPNLIQLCTTLLEPIREMIGAPMHINSGYRCPQLNAAVGGVSNSAHMTGRAADFIVPQWDLSLVWSKVKEMDLPYDQLIWEYNRMGSQWIHIAIAKPGEEPRKQILELQARPDRRFVS
jgi:hypothetical protein